MIEAAYCNGCGKREDLELVENEGKFCKACIVKMKEEQKSGSDVGKAMEKTTIVCESCGETFEASPGHVPMCFLCFQSTS